MKTIILILFTSICFSQSNEKLLSHVNDYKECRKINLGSSLNKINYARVGELKKPYEIRLKVGKDSLYHFSILVDPRVQDERKLVFRALDECVKELMFSSEVKI